MATSLDRTTTGDQPSGCFSRYVGFSSAVYLYFMVAYILLRLFLGGKFQWLALLNTFVIFTFLPLVILLPLTFIAQRWQMLTRLIVLAVVAVIWFGPFFQPRLVRVTGAPTITIATYNMQRDEDAFADNLEDFRAWLAENEVDIVLLQEVPADFSDGLDSLADNYPNQYVQPDGGPVRSILSRIPLQEMTVGDRFVRAVIQINGIDIAIYNVHLSWPIRDQPQTAINSLLDYVRRYDETQRNEEINALLEHLTGEELPYIVGGDFNMSQHSVIYSSVALEMSDSFRVANHGLGATWPVGDEWLLPTALLRLDYVWYSSPFTAIYAENGPYSGSDHLPYVTRLELRQE